MGFNHKKKRNGPLAYELLVRQMGRSLVDQDRPGYQRSKEIIQKYFAVGSPMQRERELCEAIKKARGVSELMARRVLGLVKDGYSRLDHKKLEIKKSNLIKEIHTTFGQGFWNKHRVPEYRLLASIQMFLDGSRPGRTITESIQSVELEESLVKYMGTTPPAAQVQSNIDPLVFSLAAKKFQARYGSTLGPGPKRMLECYMRSLVSGSKKELVEMLGSERKRVLSLMESHKSDPAVKDDPVMKERYETAHSTLRSLDAKSADQGALEEMMLFTALGEELESSDG
jgi:hypothetical protein